MTSSARTRQLAADGIGQRGADTLAHLVAADADEHSAIIRDLQVCDAGHGQAADRHPIATPQPI